MSADLAAVGPHVAGATLCHPSTRLYLERFVQRRVPASEVPDLVQTVLCDALAAADRPDEAGALRRFITAIARRRVIDWYRSSRQRREVPLEHEPSSAASNPEELALAQWLVAQAPDDSQRTLEWLRRSAEGEKLEHIAATEALPPPLVRKRVSRLRQLLRSRWRAELAAVALLAGLGLGVVAIHEHGREHGAPAIGREALPLSPAAVRQSLGGGYVLDQVAAGREVDPVRRALVQAQVGRLRVRIDGRTLRLSSRDLELQGPLRVSAEENGAFRAVLELSNGEFYVFRCVPDGERVLRVQSVTAPWNGELVLRPAW